MELSTDTGTHRPDCGLGRREQTPPSGEPAAGQGAPRGPPAQYRAGSSSLLPLACSSCGHWGLPWPTPPFIPSPLPHPMLHPCHVSPIPLYPHPPPSTHQFPNLCLTPPSISPPGPTQPHPTFHPPLHPMLPHPPSPTSVPPTPSPSPLCPHSPAPSLLHPSYSSCSTWCVSVFGKFKRQCGIFPS